MAVNQLVVYEKTEELMYKIYPKLQNFPKHEKFALTQMIKIEFFELLKNISLGDKVKSKRKIYLQIGDGHLQTLKVLFKLSKKRKYINVGFFEDIDLRLTEIDRMLSGYIRSA
jgi:four helix bundle protein